MAGTGKAHLRDSDQVLLRVEDLVVEFNVRGQTVHAVSGISFDVLAGETLGLVGESGCGKSTTGRAIMQLPPPTSGSVVFDSREVVGLSGNELRSTRNLLQMIFQDPISSLNPRRRIGDAVAEGLRIGGVDRAEARARADAALDAVGLAPAEVGRRRPKQFSGGQCQRICIARSLVLNPKLIICDEPVSALDVSVQAQILNLLEDMKARYGLTMVFIAHDLAVVKNVSDRIMVMYLGKVCEVASSGELFAQPAHHYTQLLMKSIPQVTFRSKRRPPSTMERGPLGDLPSPLNPPSGCRFRTRCPAAQALCAEEEPTLREIRPDHFVACHYPDLLTLRNKTSVNITAPRLPLHISP